MLCNTLWTFSDFTATSHNLIPNNTTRNLTIDEMADLMPGKRDPLWRSPRPISRAAATFPGWREPNPTGAPARGPKFCAVRV